ncbi:MAG: 3-dehydroquinate synthase [Planctomycetota bacterium]
MAEDTASVVVGLPGRAYPINIGSGLLAGAGACLRGRSSAQRVTVVTDSNVGPLYAEKLSTSLEQAGFQCHVLTVPAGDASKSAAQAAVLYDALAERRHSRTEPVVALGGGMVGDLAGFVAATWLRGVPFVQCPTTVEADVDASVGGKTAINHLAGKNLIGAFHQPLLVCIDTDCLRTLSRRDFVAGLAESVKHAVIRDAAFFAWHEDRSAAILAQDPITVRDLIRRNCENKAQVVVADEREEAEQGVGRAALNFGHTIGHAIEAQFNYELRHGEAVALGMVAAMDLAVRLCGFPDAQRHRVEALLKSLELPIRSPHPLDLPDILARLGADKKVRDRTVRFILPTNLGSVRWLDAPSEGDIEQAVRRLQGP